MWSRKNKRQRAVTAALWAKLNQRLTLTGQRLNHYLQVKSGRLTRKQLIILLALFCLLFGVWNISLVFHSIVVKVRPAAIAIPAVQNPLPPHLPDSVHMKK